MTEATAASGAEADFAIAMPIIYNRPATTFNASGVNPVFVAQFGGNLAAANLLIDAYRVQGDILSTIQDMDPVMAWTVAFCSFVTLNPVGMFFGGAGGTMPNGVGKALWLPGNNLEDPVTLHLMPAVLRGMFALM